MPRRPPPSDAVWRDGALVSPRSDDIYFSRDGGLDETALVFHAGCGLPEGWSGRPRFTIVELGFGAGLNAVATWDLWARTRSPGATLHFVTTEDRLLPQADAAGALAAFPAIAVRARRLLARWPKAAYGPQRLWFEDDGFALTVLIGDAAHGLAGLRARVDAWFLDGFAPARNPDMWSEAIFARMAALSAPGARAATYSVSGAVRRGLAAAGFAVEKKPGFAGKRERLEARFVGPAPPPRFGVLPYTEEGGSAPPRRVAVIGGGIAGAATAAAFARRGVAVRVFERADRLGAGASGNPAGLVMPRLDRGDTPLARLFRAAHLAALDAYAGGLVEMDVIERAAAPRDVAALADLAADPPLPDDFLVPAPPDGLRHRGGGLVVPADWISRWTARADLALETAVTTIAPVDTGGWRLDTTRGADVVDAVIVTAGPALGAFVDIPIERRAGQIEWAQPPATGAVAGPARVAGPYAAPFRGGLLFGATFDPADTDDVAVSDAARARNLADLARLAPDYAAAIAGSVLISRASVRATMPDRAPIAGLAADLPAWRARFAGLAHGRDLDLARPPPALPGLFVLGGLGARGLSLAPLLAETIASDACGDPHVLDADVLNAIHPSRFALRALKRGQGA
ncbi:MAG: FAD-dependent 5-carboxymethylaminomethyl-2-thiouridine(34) oxidoreductase MnmC [Alphaproteobacteria bacterium]|nr:FAD-dependent 5-carboxymethylaminomethyl-2-thiouridine(34) oxidoreductase MnmC [Alphaproteobacteria bacterium]